MIDKELLEIDGVLVPKIVKYETLYSTAWGDDTGRDIAGNNKGTFIGVFPKLLITVGELTKDEMKLFLSLVNKSNLSVKWYDAEFDETFTVSNYRADFTISLKSKSSGKYRSFTFNLIPNQKR